MKKISFDESAAHTMYPGGWTFGIARDPDDIKRIFGHCNALFFKDIDKQFVIKMVKEGNVLYRVRIVLLKELNISYNKIQKYFTWWLDYQMENIYETNNI